jgi:hypothetical protein
MLSYEQALEKLSHHANLTDAEEEGWSSFVGALFRAKRVGVISDIREPTEDLISCLDVVNRQINGQTPSASVNGEKYQRIERRAAYAVACTINSGVEYFLWLVDNAAADGSAALAMGQNLWRISCAWEAVLAGDIDSLPEHLELMSSPGRP